jgi:hypothetical protein
VKQETPNIGAEEAYEWYIYPPVLM